MATKLLLSFAFIFITINIFLNVLIVSGQAVYTEQERKTLDEFRGLVGGILTQDFQKLDSYLIRWLRSKDLDVAEADKFYRQNAKWRKDNNIDGILKETVLQLNPAPFTASGFSYDGRPVTTFSPTVVDMRQLILTGNGDKMTRYWDQILEGSEHRLELTSKKTNGTISQSISILDLQRFNIRQHSCLGCIKTFVDWAIHYENYHPLMGKNTIWINVPRAFVPVIQLVTPFLSPATQKALKIFPADKKEWSAFISKIVPPDQLTAQFGGTKPN